MAPSFYQIRYILPLSVLLLIPFSYTQRDVTRNLHNSESEKQMMWKVLKTIFNAPIEVNGENDYTLEETSEEQRKNMVERHSDYSYRRRMPYKTCKVVQEPLYESDDFEPKYKNISCVETTEDPFGSVMSYAGDHEYCYIFHHPHDSVSCETKTQSIQLFRYNQQEQRCERRSRIIGVGCGCSVGITYA
ncbi:hypothetical protein QE152_g28348 [Popillia japonica]|uniref:Uncharacterized protein n=1 Tax=Popillia japonica TaxID=7064 RepID=A0AAW1JJ31_POPJA